MDFYIFSRPRPFRLGAGLFIMVCFRLRPDHRLYLCLPRPRLPLDGGCYLYRPVPSLDFSMMNFYCALHRACAKPQCGVLGPTLRNLRSMKSPRPHKLHTALIELLGARFLLSYPAQSGARAGFEPNIFGVRDRLPGRLVDGAISFGTNAVPAEGLDITYKIGV